VSGRQRFEVLIIIYYKRTQVKAIDEKLGIPHKSPDDRRSLRSLASCAKACALSRSRSESPVWIGAESGTVEFGVPLEKEKPPRKKERPDASPAEISDVPNTLSRRERAAAWSSSPGVEGSRTEDLRMLRSHRLTRQNDKSEVNKINHPTVINKNETHSEVESLMGITSIAPSTIVEFPGFSMIMVALAWVLYHSSASAYVSNAGITFGDCPPPQPQGSAGASPGWSDLLRSANPYWISVTPRPALLPNLAECVVCKRNVRRNPTNWKEMETSMFHKKEKSDPVVNPSIIISPEVGVEDDDDR